MMAGVAVVAAILLVQGFRRGEMTGELSDHSVSEQPIQFGLSATGYSVAFALSTLFALGFQTQDLWNWATWLAAKG